MIDPALYAPLTAIAGGLGGLAVGVGWAVHIRRTGGDSAQASMIAAWIEPDTGGAARAIVMNATEFPVFGALVWFVTTSGAGPRTGEEAMRASSASPRTLGETQTGSPPEDVPVGLPIVAPGRHDIAVPTSAGGAGTQLGLEVAFSDTAGRHWIRRASGRLERIATAPRRHYRTGGASDS